MGYLGALLALVGVVWLVVTAIKTGNTTAEKVIWAIVNVIGCQPIGGIVFFVVKRQGLIPLLILLVGEVLMWYGGLLAFTGNLGALPSN